MWDDFLGGFKTLFEAIKGIAGFLRDGLAALFQFLLDGIGYFFQKATPWIISVVLAPLAFFIFGPFLRLTGYVMENVLNEIHQNMGDEVLELFGLTSWLVGNLRIQECIAALMFFLTFGLFIRLIIRIVS